MDDNQGTNESVHLGATAQHPASAPTALPSRTVSAVLALIVFWPTGILALINARRSVTLWNHGDLVGAQQADHRAKIWSRVSWAVAAVSAVVIAALITVLTLGASVLAREVRSQSLLSGADEIASVITIAAAADPSATSEEIWAEAWADAPETGEPLTLTTGRSAKDGQLLVRDLERGEYLCITLPAEPGDEATVGPVGTGAPTC